MSRWLPALAIFVGAVVFYPAPTQAHERPLPLSWHFSRNEPDHDDYTAGLTDTDSHGGRWCGFVKSGLVRPRGWGAVEQTFDARRYLGKVVRFDGWLRTYDLRGRALLYIAQDGADRVIGHTNLCKRIDPGSSGWTHYQTTLRVFEGATAIRIGAELKGTGAIGFDDFRVGVEGIDFEPTAKPATP